MICCGDKKRRNRAKLILFLGLTSIYFLVEIIVGHITGSMALVADAFHMLSDIVALVIAYVSVVMSPKRWNRNTFGFARAEVLGALSNAVFLLALCFSILVEALKKFFTPEPIENPQLVLIVGTTGLVINLFGLLLFHDHGHSHGGGHGHSHAAPAVTKEENGNVLPSLDASPKSGKHSHKSRPSQMNIRGVFLHVLGDALGSVVVIVSALVIWLADDWEYKKYVDPSLSIVIVIIIASSTIPLLMESSMVLLQTVPDHFRISDVREKLLRAVPQIQDIHEFHVWRLVADRVICTLHASLKPGITNEEQMAVSRKIKEFFHELGIHSTTVQIELPHTSDDSESSSREEISTACTLMCPFTGSSASSDVESVTSCFQSTCCGPTQPENLTGKSSAGSKNSPADRDTAEPKPIFTITKPFDSHPKLNV